MAARKKQNSISVLKDADGNRLTTYTHISNKAVIYFQSLLGTIDDHFSGCAERILAELLLDILIAAASSDIVRPVTPKEIKDIMFSIDGGKTPGPDGFNAQFFQVCW